MTIEVKSIEEYMDALPIERKEIVSKIRKIFQEHLPSGYEERLQYKMPSFVVPLSRYPKGYLNRKNEPLPFISIASQKNHIAIYHSGIYSDENLLVWAQERYKDLTGKKLDMGKSCLRFKKMEEIPYVFLKELAGKMSVEAFVELVEKVRNR